MTEQEALEMAQALGQASLREQQRQARECGASEERLRELSRCRVWLQSGGAAERLGGKR